MVSKEGQQSAVTPVEAQAFHVSEGGCSWERKQRRSKVMPKKKNASNGSRSEGLKIGKASSTGKRTKKKKKKKNTRAADTNTSNNFQRQSVKVKEATPTDQDKERKDDQRILGRVPTAVVVEDGSRGSSRGRTPSNSDSRSPSRRFTYVLSCIDKASSLVFQPKRKQTDDVMSYSLIEDQEESGYRGKNKRQSCYSTKSSSRSFTAQTTLSSLDEDIESNSRYGHHGSSSPDKLVTDTDPRSKLGQPSLSGQVSADDLSGTTVQLDGVLSSSARHQLYEPRPPPVDVLSTKSLSATPHDSPRRKSRDALYRTTSSPTMVRRRRNSSSASKSSSADTSHHNSWNGVAESSTGDVANKLGHFSPVSPSIDFMKKLSASSFYSPHQTSRMSTLSLSSSSFLAMASPSMLTSVVPPATVLRTYSFSSVIDSATAITSTSILSTPQPTLTTVSPTQESSQSKLSLTNSFPTSPTLQKFMADIRSSNQSIKSVSQAALKCEKVDQCFSTEALNDSIKLIPEAVCRSLVSPAGQEIPSAPEITSLTEAGGAQDGMDDIMNAKDSSGMDHLSEIVERDLTLNSRSQEMVEHPLGTLRTSHPSLDTIPSTSSDRPPRSPRRSLSNEPKQRRDRDASDDSSSSRTSNRSQGISVSEDCFDGTDDPFVDYDNDESISSAEGMSPKIIATPRSFYNDDHDPFFREDEIVIPLAPPSSGSKKKDVPAVKPTRSPSKEGSFSSRENGLAKDRRIPGRQDLISALRHYSVLSPDGRFSKDKSKLWRIPPAAHVASDPPRPPQRKKSNDDLVSPPRRKKSNDKLVSPTSSRSIGKIPRVIIPSKVTTPVSPLPTHSRHQPSTRAVDDDPLWLDDTPRVDPTGDIGQQNYQNLEYHRAATTNSIPHIHAWGLDRWGEHNLPTPNASPRCRVQEKHDTAKMTLSPPDDRWK